MFSGVKFFLSYFDTFIQYRLFDINIEYLPLYLAPNLLM
jgi:hypothetical protein